jgi:hypothetical protein
MPREPSESRSISGSQRGTQEGGRRRAQKRGRKRRMRRTKYEKERGIPDQGHYLTYF